MLDGYPGELGHLLAARGSGRHDPSVPSGSGKESVLPDLAGKLGMQKPEGARHSATSCARIVGRGTLHHADERRRRSGRAKGAGMAMLVYRDVNRRLGGA